MIDRGPYGSNMKPSDRTITVFSGPYGVAVVLKALLDADGIDTTHENETLVVTDAAADDRATALVSEYLRQSLKPSRKQSA